MLIERHNSSGAFFDYGPISFCLLAMLVANKLARNEMNRDRESMNRAAFLQNDLNINFLCFFRFVYT